MTTPAQAVLALFLAAAAPAVEPAAQEQPPLARMPALKNPIRAELPPGTRFPAPSVAVVMEIDVDDQGRVAEVRITEGAGEPFDAAAVAAARRFEFEPAALATGEQVPVTITFKLRIDAPPPPPKPPVTLNGRLLERGTRVPLAGVEVVALEEGRPVAGAITGEDGRFQLVASAQRFLVKAVPAGHQVLEAQLDALAGEQRDETFFLETRSSAFETVVSASAVRREVTRQVIPKEIVATAAGTQGDTLKVVQNLPGVARSSFGGGQLILRGSAPGDSRTFLEGQEIPLLYHFAGIRSTFNSAFLESVEFFPGNFAPDYGRAIGGVVEVRVREPAADLLRGQFDLNLYDAGAAAEGPVGRGWKVGGAFHRSYIDTLLPLALPEDAPLTFDTAPRYYDYQALATWKGRAKQQARIVFFGSMDRLELLFDRPASDPAVRGALSTDLSFHSLQGSYRSEPLPGLTQETSVQLGLQSISTAIGPDFFFDLDVRRFSLRSTASRRLAPWIGVRAGMDIRLDGVTIALNSPQAPKEGENGAPVATQEVLGVRTRATLYSPAIFGELRLEPFDKLELLPSVRADWYRELQRWSLDPRLAARWQLRERTAIAAGVGLFQQPPAPDESNALTGNPDLFPERALHVSAGVEQGLGDGLELTATGFYKSLDRLVVRNTATFFLPGAPRYASDGSGRIYGLELQLRGRVTPALQGWVAYTFQRSLRTDGGGAQERLFDFDQPHILTALGSYDLGRGWSLGARFRLVSGNPSTPVTGALYDAATDTYVPTYGDTNSERLPLFHQLDVRVDKVWTFDTWKLGAYLDVQNVYNRKNAEGWSYSYDYTRRQPLSGLPILPIAGLRGEI